MLHPKSTFNKGWTTAILNIYDRRGLNWSLDWFFRKTEEKDNIANLQVDGEDE